MQYIKHSTKTHHSFAIILLSAAFVSITKSSEHAQNTWSEHLYKECQQ